MEQSTTYKTFNKENTRKPYKKPRVKKETKIINFEKSFESLNEMVAELKLLHPEIDEKILPYDDENVTSDNLISDLLNYYANNIPNIVDGKNIICTLNLCANKVALKTNKFFTVGWRFKFDKNGFITDIVASITVFSRDNNAQPLENMIGILKDTWTEIENKIQK